MPLTCLEATNRLHQVKKLQEDFALALEDALQDSSNATQLYQQLSYELAAFAQELEKNSLTITVKDAQNPFHERLKTGGVPDEENPEKKEIIIDLFDTLEEDIKSYRSHGLEQWAQALEAHKDKVVDLTEEQRKIIEGEIKNGAIPIWIPGKEALLSTTAEQLEKAAVPRLIMGEVDWFAQDARLRDGIIKNFVEKHDPRLFEGVSQPYISFHRPTSTPDQRTCSKTFQEQRDEFVKINNERALNSQVPVRSVSLYEYIALQIRSTEALVGNKMIKKLYPLDIESHTIFIDLYFPEWKRAPFALFIRGLSVLHFDSTEGEDRSPKYGFRLAVRVEV